MGISIRSYTVNYRLNLLYSCKVKMDTVGCHYEIDHDCLTVTIQSTPYILSSYLNQHLSIWNHQFLGQLLAYATGHYTTTQRKSNLTQIVSHDEDDIWFCSYSFWSVSISGLNDNHYSQNAAPYYSHLLSLPWNAQVTILFVNNMV